MLNSFVTSIRTALDYEMMPFAFRNNSLQNYIYQLNDPELFVAVHQTIDPIITNVERSVTIAQALVSPMPTAVTVARRMITGSRTSVEITAMAAALAESSQLRPRSQVFYHTTRYGQ